MRLEPFDVVIVGGGLAGLMCSLEIAPLRVLLVTSAPLLAGGSSPWAQGGIAAVMTPLDSFEQHVQDTLVAGAGHCNEKRVRDLVHAAPKAIRSLESYGVCFDSERDGSYALAREGGHHQARVLHLSGDRSGYGLVQQLSQKVREASHIQLLEGYRLLSLDVDDVLRGASFESLAGGHSLRVCTSSVVLATGGCGGLWRVSTNPPQALGDGLYAAHKAGARLQDLAFMQFHPTAMDVGLSPAPLATEALRGAGARLVTGSGRCFMEGIHSLGDLAPRDVVARAVYAQNQLASSSPSERAYLDARSLGSALKTFGAFQTACEQVGLDPSFDLIPIAPAAHYHMGGIAANLAGETSISGLFAVGEVACTGVHGANRLASNSLLECVVMAQACAKSLQEASTHQPGHADDGPSLSQHSEVGIQERVKNLFDTHLNVLRDRESLLDALDICHAQRAAIMSPRDEQLYVLLTCFLHDALERPLSLGAHAMTSPLSLRQTGSV